MVLQSSASLRARRPRKYSQPSVVLVAVCGLLSSCGHPQGVMAPVASVSVPGAKHIDMLVATSRQPSENPATLFNGERSPNLHLADVAISIPPNRQSGTVEWPRRLPPNPKTDFAVTRVKEISPGPEAKAWFNQHAEGGHVLVFVHGFNNRFEDAVFRLAQIVSDSGANATPVLFTWPSRASLLGYNYDKESTNYSRTALEQGLRTLAENPKVTDITVLAHSMGTWLTMESLRQMGIRDGHVASKIHNVILASPDIDIDVFAKQFVEMGEPHPKFTIFVSQDDKALAVSRLISGDVLRLGAINPTEEPYLSELEKSGITAIDLTKIKTGDSMNHGKFAESPEIVQLIGKRLITGQTLTDSDISLGDGITAVVAGTAQTIGNVAGTTASMPIKMITAPQAKKKSADSLGDTLKSDNDTKALAN